MQMNANQWDSLWINACIATMQAGYGLLPNAAIACQNGQIAWLGPMIELPASPSTLAKNVYDLAGKCLTPGLIDCHTHLVYAGNRANEFELLLQGQTYAAIAKSGGGIQATVSATRSISEQDLFTVSLARAQTMLAQGVTTIEIKSGYGLNLETELKILRVAKRIGEVLPVTIKSTFLGAHSLPVEYKNDAESYIDKVCNEMIPAIAAAGLAQAVDVFCEKIGFNLAQAKRVFQAAKAHGLSIKCHAEQLSDMGASMLASQYQACSVDHLEFLSEPGVKAIAQSNTVAVLLPGAYYFLQEKQLPPLALLQEYGVPIAIATDCNPGTSPTTSLVLMMNMACTLFKMTPEQAWAGVTTHAAQALGLAQTHGALALGMQADFAIWDVAHPRDVVYQFGAAPLYSLVKHGKVVDMS
jgi:imidazolonepropionase